MAAGIGSLELLQQTPVLPGFIYYSAVIIACEKGQRQPYQGRRDSLLE